jgi:hypothetical protein
MKKKMTCFNVTNMSILQKSLHITVDVSESFGLSFYIN